MTVDLLRRSLAPVSAAAWHEIDAQARSVLTTHLTARALVDFQGPFGWEYAAVNVGRLEVSRTPAPHGVPWGTRKVQPLIEVRIPFTLSQMEIDSVDRGARDIDLKELEAAATKLAAFEESAIYEGFPAGQIKGVIPSSGHRPIMLPTSAHDYQTAVAESIRTLDMAGIHGPYVLVLGTRPYYDLLQADATVQYPHSRIIQQMLGTGGRIEHSPVLAGGVLISVRGGDFEFTSGQDISIGYAGHDREHVELFITESFTFRVLESKAAIELRNEAASLQEGGRTGGGNRST